MEWRIPGENSGHHEQLGLISTECNVSAKILLCKCLPPQVLSEYDFSMKACIQSRTRNDLARKVICMSVLLLCFALSATPVFAQSVKEVVPRTAVVSAFSPELTLLKSEIQNSSTTSINGIEFQTGKLAGKDVVLFLSGISIVNATMTVQLALDHFNIKQVIFSGIAGGADPELDIGDVVIADQWGQYLEMVYARKVDNGWETIPFFEYPHDNFGMMFPRSVEVIRDGLNEPETRFWFPVDESLLAQAKQAASGLELSHCTEDGRCLSQKPKVVIGGSGVSGSAFIDNAEFREYAFRVFQSRVIDMESSAVAHVAWANKVPFLAIRSLSDLAGAGDHKNQIEIFTSLAAENSAKVVMSLLGSMASEQ